MFLQCASLLKAED